MAKFFNITSATNTILAQASDYSVFSTSNKRGLNNVTISKLIIANYDAGSCTVQIWLDHASGTDYYVTGVITIPGNGTLVWDTPFTFNVSTHTLKLTNTTAGSARVSVIME